jgi:hypothetical protein
MAYWMNGILHDPKGELTAAPELPDVVAFNIADGSFEFFTTAQFQAQIELWREELDDGDEYDDEDVIDMVNGDEFFWEWLPTEVK